MIAKEIRKAALLPAVALLLLIMAISPTLAAGPVAGDGGIVFSLHAPDAEAVFLAGEFNGWNASDLPLQAVGDGNWSVVVALAPGSHEYKFVVDGVWREDPDNPERIADPFGGSNSVVTVQADGSLADGALPTAAITAPEVTTGADIAVGAPHAVTGGVAFSYRDDGANRVTLAGSFNGWNADELPLTNDGKGNWVLVHELGAGKHEYKFVVDGNWVADPANPDTQADPYGGVNSVITVDDQGQLIATTANAGTATPASNNTLNAKVTIDGRYLTRFEYAKNVPVAIGEDSVVDPRYRLQRPSQSVDLNFHTEVSDAASTFMRLRFDSNENIIQNNVAAFLDEAHLEIHPEKFSLRAYWNQEIFSGEDPLHLGGDVDLPGTILHDHLDYGKGTAGALFVADPLGVRTRLFFANVHNYDYYNDPDLFDNIGEDRIGLRLSRRFGKFAVGTPIYAERSLVWLDFGTEVGQASTGIPALDEHRANTEDSSTWYEVDQYQLYAGLDLSYDLDERWTLGAEALYLDAVQRFATGNEAGQNNTNGAMDVPFLNRDGWLWLGQVAYEPHQDSQLTLRHYTANLSGGHPDQRQLTFSFLPQTEANKQVKFTIGDSPAIADLDSTELTWDWRGTGRTAILWLRRAGRDFDYGAVGQTAPEDSTVTDHSQTVWYLAGNLTNGEPHDRLGQFELEAGYRLADRGLAGLKNNQLELIFRYDRNLTRDVGLIADLRFSRYHLEGHADGTTGETTDTDYFNPFVGCRYTPIDKLKLVLAYGVDPVDYSIDYGGRQIGRWLYRQNYVFDHPDATVLEAENFLKHARVVTLRAQLKF